MLGLAIAAVGVLIVLAGVGVLVWFVCGLVASDFDEYLDDVD